MIKESQNFVKVWLDGDALMQLVKNYDVKVGHKHTHRHVLYEYHYGHIKHTPTHSTDTCTTTRSNS
mgnify:CR=1 FL=1